MINSWTINLVLGLILSVMIGGGIYMWRESVADMALLEYKTQEYTKLIDQQKKAMEDTKAILEESVGIVNGLKEETNKTNEKLKELDVYLNNNKDDKQSSEVLKRTFKELSQ